MYLPSIFDSLPVLPLWASSYEVFVISRASISKCQYTGLLDACKRSVETDGVFIDVADLTQFLNQGEPNVPIPSV
jgi:hypothetical protein